MVFITNLSVWTLDALFRTDGLIVQSVSVDEQYFSVIINTYKRPQMLAQAMRHYAQTCGRRTGVSQVFVIWAEDNTPPDPSSFFDTSYLKGSFDVDNQSVVQIIKVPKSLNSRFLPIQRMSTTGLFMVDDDVQVDCESLRKGFHAWKAHPDSMVGYYPRLAAPPRGQTAESAGYIEHCWPIVFLRQQVNFVLTKASFLHSRYLELYSSSNHPQEIKNYVDLYMNCEDVAMSLLVANITHYEKQRPAIPIYVEGIISDQGLFNGISTGAGFVDRRANCLTDLSRIYERIWSDPLDYTYTLAEASWTKHFPGFWWQHRPSNPFEWGALLDLLK